MNVCIYGAQAIALGTYLAIKKLHKEWNVLCFLVTEMGNNAATLGGLPVRELNEFSASLTQIEKQEIRVLIGTPENVMSVIEESLSKEGFCDVQRMDSVRWANLQEQAFMEDESFKVLTSFPDGEKAPKISVYMAKFWKDKELTTSCQVPGYMIPIQAGAALTETRVADVLDCEGDNISNRNGNYSELTALYWMWKNVAANSETDDIYYGLAHYRRFLMLEETELKKMQAGNVDVVLPFPMPYEPSIEVHHERYLADEMWSCVKQAIHEIDPAYEEKYEEILKQGYMYNYNISVAKKPVFESYCEWLFKILFRVEELYDPDRKKTPSRYVGYIGEMLTTLYYMSRKNQLNIAHKGCRFIV